MVLLIDNYDSFTYNLYDYVCQIGLECKVIRNDQLPLNEIKLLDFDSIILSPGPCTPADSGVLIELIEYFKDKKPILGICLGYQAIGQVFGATLIKAPKPVHGKTSNIVVDSSSNLFKDLPPKIEVMRYHSLVLEELMPPLKITARTDNMLSMAFEHECLPIAGVQFHPESILTEHGLSMLRNWFSYIND